MKRKIAVTVEPVEGSFTIFIVILNKEIILHGEAEKMTYEGEVEENKEILIQTRASGIGSGPKYKVTVDLPGDGEDFKANYTLKNGYHETSISI